MKISILCVGKVKEKFYVQAIDEFTKRLSRYCKLEIIEVADEKTPDSAGDALEDMIPVFSISLTSLLHNSFSSISILAGFIGFL